MAVFPRLSNMVTAGPQPHQKGCGPDLAKDVIYETCDERFSKLRSVAVTRVDGMGTEG